MPFMAQNKHDHSVWMLASRFSPWQNHREWTHIWMKWTAIRFVCVRSSLALHFRDVSLCTINPNQMFKKLWYFVAQPALTCSISHWRLTLNYSILFRRIGKNIREIKVENTTMRNYLKIEYEYFTWITNIELFFHWLCIHRVSWYWDEVVMLLPWWQPKLLTRWTPTDQQPLCCCIPC